MGIRATHFRVTYNSGEGYNGRGWLLDWGTIERGGPRKNLRVLGETEERLERGAVVINTGW